MRRCPAIWLIDFLTKYDGHKINVKKGAFSDNKSFHIQS